MTSTVENINSNILNKIDSLNCILSIYNEFDLGPIYNQLASNMLKQVEEIQATYEYGSIAILREYYQMIGQQTNNHKNNKTCEVIDLHLEDYFPDVKKNTSPVTEKKKNIEISLKDRNAQKMHIYNLYMKFIENENTIGKIKQAYNICSSIHRKYGLEDPSILLAIQKYNSSSIEIEYNERRYDVCVDCKVPLSIDPKLSEYICKKCGSSEKMYGVVFEDEQFFFQEGQRTKHGKYDPAKHCKFWVDRILARETVDDEDFPLIIKKVKQCIKRDKIRLKQLSCEMIRVYLKELHKTTYNDHVPLICKLITKQEPEQLTDHELKLLYVYFGRVIQIFTKIKPISKPNCPYHPYFIYKIIEQLLKKTEHSSRRKEILSNIHLQSRDTLIENDQIWAQIVTQIPEFSYTPTESY